MTVEWTAAKLAVLRDAMKVEMTVDKRVANWVVQKEWQKAAWKVEHSVALRAGTMAVLRVVKLVDYWGAKRAVLTAGQWAEQKEQQKVVSSAEHWAERLVVLMVLSTAALKAVKLAANWDVTKAAATAEYLAGQMERQKVESWAV